MSFQETSHGVLLDRVEPPTGLVFTVGYEGRTLGEFLTIVCRNRVRRVIDVREKPLSRKQGFSRLQLETALKGRGIGYFPLKELGSPGAARQEYRSGGTFVTFAKRYGTHLEGQTRSLEVLKALSSEMPSAILCFERNWKACHRKVLSDYLERQGFRLEHL